MAKSIALFTPVTRGKSTVKDVTITDAMKQTGSLRGLKLYDVMSSDVDSLIKLLPRITSPALTEAEVTGLHPSDLAQFAVAVADFLAPPSAQSETAAAEA